MQCAPIYATGCGSRSDSSLIYLSRRVVIADERYGDVVAQSYHLELDDFAGLEGCNEILNVTRPDVVREIHQEYFAAGADAVEKIPSAPTSLISPSTTSPTASASSPKPAPASHARLRMRQQPPTARDGFWGRSGREPSCPRSDTPRSRSCVTRTNSR